MTCAHPTSISAHNHSDLVEYPSTHGCTYESIATDSRTNISVPYSSRTNTTVDTITLVAIIGATINDAHIMYSTSRTSNARKTRNGLVVLDYTPLDRHNFQKSRIYNEQFRKFVDVPSWYRGQANGRMDGIECATERGDERLSV